MPDWKVTLTRAVSVNGQPKSLQIEHTVEDVLRPLAVYKGLDEIFNKEAEAGFKLIPKEAVEYWYEQRRNGSLKEYELLSEIEMRWGITSGIQEVKEEVAPPQHPNGTARVAAPESLDLDSMLKNQMRMLQDRNAILNANIAAYTAERDKNDANIMRIAQFLGGPVGDFVAIDKAVREVYEIKPPLTPANPAKRRGRPPKEAAHVE